MKKPSPNWLKLYDLTTNEYLGVVWWDGDQWWVEDRNADTWPCESAAYGRLLLRILGGYLTDRSEAA